MLKLRARLDAVTAAAATADHDLLESPPELRKLRMLRLDDDPPPPDQLFDPPEKLRIDLLLPPPPPPPRRR